MGLIIEMKKVLIVANSDSGLYNFRKELVQKLLEDHQVVLCLPAGDYTETFREMGCEYIDCSFDRHGKNFLKELKLLRFYKKILKRERPDIVLTYTIKPNIYAGMACASLGIPYVANITGLGTAVENGGLLQKITLILYKRGLRKAKKVFFQNTENRDFMLKNGVVKGNYDLLPGSGVNLERFRLLPYPDSDKIEFLFIARVMKEKGIDQYLDAAKRIREQYPNTVFHVCGSCEQNYQEKLKDYHEKGIIVYHGRVNNIAAMHEISSCTIHPTYYPEGLSNVLLESLASGRPIITTDRAGCREVVEDGINGFVVNQKDSCDLIEKIERFLALSIQERRQMGIAGRAKVEREFDRKIVIEKYLGELNGL